MKKTKPPIGLKPRNLHKKSRIYDILAAIERYLRAGEKIPYEWQTELCNLLGDG